MRIPVSARAEGPAIPPELRFVQSRIPDSGHLVQFYETDRGLLESLRGFIGEGLMTGESCLVIATNEHRQTLDEMLRTAGVDIAALSDEGKYVCLDARETLSQFLVNGVPDVEKFKQVVGDLVFRMAGGQGRLRIFGEMVALLWAKGNREDAIRLERFWNDLRSTREFALLCAYPMTTMAEATPEFVSVRLEAEAERRRQVEAELTDFLANAIDGLHRATPDGTILWANHSELAMLGYPADEYIGHHISEFHADKHVIEDILARLERNETVINCEARMWRKDGSIRHVLINANARWSEGKYQYLRSMTRDVTALKRSREAELFLSAIVESADDAIISKTPQGVITSWNPAAEKVFGYTANEAIGRPITILIPEERGDEEKGILEKIHRGEHIDHYETKRIRKDGRIIDVSITVSPLKNEYGGIIGASKIARDITDRKQADVRREQLLLQEQKARTTAEHANRMKDEFLATVSHELRTPLNAIIGWCHMLKNRELDSSLTSRAIDTIDRNAKAQAQLVEDILDVSRVIAGKLQLSVGRVDLSAVINSAIDSVQLAADTKGIHIEVTADPRIRYIRGDATRLQQVVWNLLSNAVKFTPGGGRINVRLQRSNANVEISVSDTGEGIPSEFLPFIFERFSQADSSTTRRQGGLGLGLAIVRHLSELHGGSVSAESSGKGLGATFIVRLPLSGLPEQWQPLKTNQLNIATERYSRGAAPDQTLEGIRILIVDDNLDTLHMLAAHLSDYKATVETATSAAEALELLESYRPQVLVSDVAMPHEDGYSLISKIRKSELGNQNGLRAIALTALARVEDRARALSAGFNMFVPKPVEPMELVAAIVHLMQPDKLTGTDSDGSRL